MLIEVRSSATALNNTPSFIFNNFKDTMIIKPHSKIALASALITTNRTNPITIDSSNNDIKLTLGDESQFNLVIPVGDYTTTTLATAVLNAITTAITGAGYEIYYPLANQSFTYQDKVGFQVNIQYAPSGYNEFSFNEATNVDLENVNQLNLAYFAKQDSTSQSGSVEVKVDYPLNPYGVAVSKNNFEGNFTLGSIGDITGGNNIRMVLQEDTGATYDIGDYDISAGNTWTNTANPTWTILFTPYTGGNHYQYVESLYINGLISYSHYWIQNPLFAGQYFVANDDRDSHDIKDDYDELADIFWDAVNEIYAMKTKDNLGADIIL